MAKPKDIRNLNMQERKAFLDSFDIIMTDCDGVLWLTESPINGSIDTLKMLQYFGKKVIFVSNNTTRSTDDYINKLRKMGYEATPDQIITPSSSIVWYLKKIEFNSKAFTIATQPFIKTLVDNGIDVIVGPNSIEESSAAVINILSSPQLNVGAVIVDFDINLNFIKMAQVELLLQKKNILLLVGTRDYKLPLTDTQLVLGPGPFIDMIIKYSGCTPIEYAKPSSILKDFLFDRFHINNPSRCIFIGDSLEMDMKFADICGFMKLWVGSGIDELDSLCNTSIIPDYYLPNLGAMPKLIDN